MYNLLIKAEFKSSGTNIKAGNEVFIDMYDFIFFLESRVVKITNELLKIISLEIYGASDEYEIWKMLDFPKKPYIL